MDLRPINDNENRLRAGSVSDLVWSFFSSASYHVFQRSGCTDIRQRIYEKPY